MKDGLLVILCIILGLVLAVVMVVPTICLILWYSMGDFVERFSEKGRER